MKNSQKTQKIFLEALVLYIILFFSPGFEALYSDIQRILLYSLPSLALLWHLISDRNGFKALFNEKAAKKDILVFVISLVALLCIALSLSSLITVFSTEVPQSSIEIPSSLPQWIMIFISCIFTGYLEESYFRYYLLGTMEEHIKGKLLRVLFSVMLFTLCHSYAGIFSMINAALSGTLLSLIFLRFRSLHGIAMAHALYNFSVYLLAGLVP